MNRSSCLAPALGVTKFIIVKAIILVTLCCSMNPPQPRLQILDQGPMLKNFFVRNLRIVVIS
jgi:hypothetical protein